MPRHLFRVLIAAALLAPVGCGDAPSTEQGGPKDPEAQKEQQQDLQRARQKEWRGTKDR